MPSSKTGQFDLGKTINIAEKLLIANYVPVMAGPPFPQDPGKSASSETRHRGCGHRSGGGNLWHLKPGPTGKVGGEMASGNPIFAWRYLWVQRNRLGEDHSGVWSRSLSFRPGRAGPDSDRWGELLGRLWEEAGEGTGHPDPISDQSVQVDWPWSPASTTAAIFMFT